MSTTKEKPRIDAFDHASGRHIESGGAKIYIEERGKPGAPVLVLLHGGFGSVEDFNSVAPALASRFRLVGVDSRGHGRSTLGSAPLSYRLLAEDLGRVIESLALEEFGILGFSDGGIAAYRWAAGRDPRLKKLVTVGSSWEMSEGEPAWKLITGMTGAKWKRFFPASHEAYLRLNPEPDFGRFAEKVTAMWKDMSPDGHPGDLVKRIACDILAVRGDRDRITSLASLARLQALVKKANVLNIPFADHAAFDDAPEIFLAAVDAFFGGRTKSGSE